MAESAFHARFGPESGAQALLTASWEPWGLAHSLEGAGNPGARDGRQEPLHRAFRHRRAEQLPSGADHRPVPPAFLTYAYQTPDLKRRVQFSATDGLGTGDPTPAYQKLLNEIFC